ncbi:hypothetical protein [Pseudoalteromonas phage PH357]|nr:hypothetical protein [Pseudoalteromonas phage PH357]
MLKFTKRFQGSYYTTLSNGCEISVQSYAQYSGCESQDFEGNKWVVSLDCDFDWDGDHTHKALTKRECIEYANRMAEEFEQLTKS